MGAIPMNAGHVIVLGCAKTRRPDLAAVVEVLVGRGNAVEVVSGLEHNQRPWTDAVNRLGKRGVYILCGSPELRPAQVAHWRRAAVLAGVPEDQIWAGQLDWSQPVSAVRVTQELLARSGKRLTPPHMAAQPPPPPQPPSGVTPSGKVPVAGPEEPVLEAFTLGDRIRHGMQSRAARIATIAGAAAILLGTSLAVAMSGDGDEETNATVAAKSQTAEPTPVSDPEPEAQPPTPAPSVAATAAAATAEPPTPTPTATPTAAAAPTPTPTPTVATPESPKVAAPTASTDEDAVEVVEVDDLPTASETQRIFAALAARKVRALDILLIAPEAAIKRRKRWKWARMNYKAANAYCEKLNVAGVRGWRLPNIGELKSLNGSRMISDRNYWSSTRGDAFGQSRVIWNGFKDKMGPAPQRWRRGSVICVQTHAGAKAE